MGGILGKVKDLLFGEAPKAPDPKKIIDLQGQWNTKAFNDMLNASRVNTTTPFGTQTWSKTQLPSTGFDPKTGLAIPGADQWNYNVQLSPEQQQLYDANMRSQIGQATTLDALTRRVQDATKNPLDFSSVPGYTMDLSAGGRGPVFDPNLDPNAYGRYDVQGADLSPYLEKINQLDPWSFYQEGADAMYRQQARYLDPQMSDFRRAEEARLAEQGFVPDTPAYSNTMDDFFQSRERAYADARDRAILQGASFGDQAFDNSLSALQTGMGGELSRFGADLQGAQFDLNQDNADWLREMQNAGLERQAALDENDVVNQLFGRELAAAGFNNSAIQDQLARLILERSYPLNELNAMRTGTQVQLPNQQAQYSTPNMQAPDVFNPYQMQFEGQLGAYNSDVGFWSDLMGSAMKAFGPKK